MQPFASRIRIELLSIICVIIFGATAAYAAAGNLDPTFGQAGKTAASFGSPILIASAALQSDGKILVLFSNNGANFTLARFLANGSLDTTFGSGGSAQTIFATFNFPETVTIQPEGQIVVTGFATNNLSTFFFAVARFNSDGSLDTTFGSGGQAVANVTGSLETSVGLLQPDGKILVAGSALVNPRRAPQLAMARFNPDGSGDRNFGRNGQVQLISPVNTPSALGVDASGNIFVNAGPAIAEFGPGGNSDAQVTPAAILAAAHAGNVVTAFQTDGKYVFADPISEGSFRQRDTDTKLVRFTATGGVDPTFNSPTFDFVGEGGTAQGDAATALAMQPNGQIVLASAHTSGGFSEFALVRLNSDGSRDLNFGPGGLATTNVAGVEILKDLLVQGDGKILAIGTANGFSQIVLARFLAQ